MKAYPTPIAAFLLAAASMLGFAHAADVTSAATFNPTTGSWTDSASWTITGTAPADGLPGADSSATIGSGKTANLTSGVANVGQLFVRGGTLNITGATLNANAGATAYGQWAIGTASETSTLYIGTGGKLYNTKANITLGAGNNSTNLIDLDGGTFEVGANRIMFGMGTGAEANRAITTLRIRNNGTFTSSGNTTINVGRDAYSNGALELLGGTFYTIGLVTIGDNTATSVGTANISSGSFTSGALSVGDVGTGTMVISQVGAGVVTNVKAASITVGNSGTGSLTMTGGNINSTGAVIVGSAVAGTGSLAISGGVFTSLGLTVGNNGKGEMEISGASTKVTASAISVGASNSGLLTITGGEVKSTGNFIIGNNVTGVGSVDISGGELTTGGMTVGSLGTGEMKISGASTKVTAASMVVGGSGKGSLSITGGDVKSNGTVIVGSTEGSNGVGALTVSGTGTKFTVATGGILLGQSSYNESLANISTLTVSDNAQVDIQAGNLIIGAQKGLVINGSGDSATASYTAGGSAAATISGATVNLATGLVNIGVSSTGSLTMNNATLNSADKVSSMIGGNARYDNPDNAKVFNTPAGEGSLVMTNSTWKMGDASTNTDTRLLVAQTGTGSLVLNDSSITGLLRLQIGNYYFRELAVDAATYGGDKVSAMLGRGTGSVVLNGNSSIVLNSASQEVAVGVGATGSLTINGGEFSTAGNIRLGDNANVTLSVSSGGKMTATPTSYSGNGLFIQTGGMVKANALLVASGVNGTVSGSSGVMSNGAATISGGSLEVKQLFLGADSSLSSGLLAVSNNASVRITGDFRVLNGGELRFMLEGASFGSAPIINAAGASFGNMKREGKYVIDMSAYAATENQTITLMSYTGKPGASGDIQFTIEGLDESKYAFTLDDIVWGATSLTASVFYIPESSAAAGLFGLFALAFVVRRRRK